MNCLNKGNILLLLILLLITTLEYTSGQNSACKTRLPKIINNYNPTIVPVISIDGKYLYFDRKEHPENTGAFKDVDEIWFSKKIQNKYWSQPQRLESSINTIESDVIFSISPNGKKALLYGIYTNDSLIKKNGFSIADRNGNTFSNLKPLIINNYYNQSKNFYANLSADGRVLLMSIKRDYCYGSEDIYVSFLIENNEWSEPINLGNDINTKFEDISPFLAYDGKTIYFSSNGRKGFGDFDIYMSKRLDDTWKNWSTPINLGKNINTPHRDNGLYMTALSDTAYFVSSEQILLPSEKTDVLFDTINLRQGIYYACIPKELQPEPYAIVHGRVMTIVDDDSLVRKKPVRIEVSYKTEYNLQESFHNVYYSNENTGEFLFAIPSHTRRQINVFAEGYYREEFQIQTSGLKKPQYIHHDIILTKKIDNSKPCLTIQFEINDDMLLNESERKILNLLSEINNFEQKFKIIGHADETGSNAYNLALSIRRAQNTARYLMKQGIKSSNIILEGKGETKPKGKSPDLNRRVELFLR